MGWSGSLTESSAVGSSITFAPGTTTEGAYVVSSFTAPRKGVYRFILKGSGGTKYASPGKEWNHCAAGGKGGYTVGYLLLEKGQTVYIGAGGTCSAAFVAAATGTSLSAISKTNLYFVAAGGGAGGAAGESKYDSGVMAMVLIGADGGGTSGSKSNTSSFGASQGYGGTGGTQSAGGTAGGWTDDSAGTGASGAYGVGGKSTKSTYDTAVAIGGRGGDGLYGGGSGNAYTDSSYHTYAYSGGGGSSYIKTASLMVGSNTYTSSTTTGGGASSNTAGSVQVTYYARAELHVFFDGAQLERIIFNNTELGSLVFNGTTIFMEGVKRCLKFMASAFGFRAAIPA